MASTEDVDLFDDNDSDLPRKLRAKIKELQKANDELQERVVEIDRAKRTESITSALTEFGVNPKVAALVPSDLPVEELRGWVEQYADVFGASQQQSAVDPARVAASNRMQALDQTGVRSVDADVHARLDAAQTEAEVMEILQSL